MKLMWAECCGTLVVPDRRNHVVKHCDCKQAAVWWEDGKAGKLVVYAMLGKEHVSVLGLMNDLLLAPFTKFDNGREYGCIQGDRIRQMHETCPPSYIFRQLGSVIGKFRPGFTNDTRLAELDEYTRVAGIE